MSKSDITFQQLTDCIRAAVGPEIVKFELLPVCKTVREACEKLRQWTADKSHQVDILLVDNKVLQLAMKDALKKLSWVEVSS